MVHLGSPAGGRGAWQLSARRAPTRRLEDVSGKSDCGGRAGDVTAATASSTDRVRRLCSPRAQRAANPEHVLTPVSVRLPSATFKDHRWHVASPPTTEEAVLKALSEG
ncbi:hypothetical protein NDU88_008112 [Pleurodeles waltl]|uniref:Uncharacterized protein n=1 Tax=Pleurodeles waltl TaxID=8319 RepID=A0AAV7NZB3_PLEWA|nr:hypothetical protein NDU88_008112 [Pleurodeles waltl]